MQRIAPLQFGDRSPTVANLQDALQLFCDLVSLSIHQAMEAI